MQGQRLKAAVNGPGCEGLSNRDLPIAGGTPASRRQFGWAGWCCAKFRAVVDSTGEMADARRPRVGSASGTVSFCAGKSWLTLIEVKKNLPGGSRRQGLGRRWKAPRFMSEEGARSAVRWFRQDGFWRFASLTLRASASPGCWRWVIVPRRHAEIFPFRSRTARACRWAALSGRDQNSWPIWLWQDSRPGLYGSCVKSTVLKVTKGV